MPTPCPSCHKLCSLENADPEVQDLQITGGTITATVRLVRQSACCGDEMKEYNYELEHDASDAIKRHEDEFHKGEAQDYDVEEGDVSSDESGGGRYKKNMISVQLSVSVTCNGEHEKQGLEVVDNIDLTDETAASSFDELV